MPDKCVLLRRRVGYLLSFSIPAILYIALCAVNNIYPVGSTTNLTYDLNNQYADFFLYFREVLLGNADISYSFSKSIGGSLVALFGYYLSSPLNLLIVFFSADQLQLFVFTVTALKIALCGLTFSVFIANKMKNCQIWQMIICSSAYAFTQYTVGQMSNLPWLDGVYLLPLLLLAVDRFIEKNSKFPLYVLVIITIIFNWYTGYMNCLFIAIYFLYQIILHSYEKYRKLNIGIIVRKAIPFYLTELLGVLGSMFFFLPVVFAQMGGRGADEKIFEFSTNGSLLNILRGFMIGSANPSKEITLYCSTVLMLMLGYFFIDKSVAIYEKVISGVFLGVMVASLFFTPLEHIWVGFKFENSFAYRFLYLVIAVIIMISCRVLARLHEIEKRTIWKFAFISIITFLSLDLLKQFDAKRLWIEISLILLYTILLLWTKSNKKKRNVIILHISMTLLFMAEILFNAKIVIAGVYQGDGEDYIAYVQKESELIDQIRPEDEAFYRIEKTLNRDNSVTHDSYIANESMTYLYSGIQQYTSSYDKGTSELLINLGYCRSEFPSFYHDPILPADSLLGVRYLLSEKDYQGYELCSDYDAYNGKSVYENPYALPLAFCASDDITDVFSSGNPFEYMNDIYSGILGESCMIYEPFNNYRSRETDNGLRYEIEGLMENQILYVRIPGDSLNLEISRNGEEWQPYQTGWLNHNVFPVEKEHGNASVEIKSETMEDINDIKIQFYVLDYNKLVAALEKIENGSSENLKIGQAEISFTASGDNVLLTIPYDPSWKVNVNGERIEAVKGADAFMLIPLNGADNAKVTMEYHVKGQTAGMFLSVLSFVVIIGWIIIGIKGREKM